MKRVTMIVLPVVALACFSSFVEALWVGSENPGAAKTSKSTGAGVQPKAHDTGVQVGVDGGTRQEQNKPKDTRKVTFVLPQSNAGEHVDVPVVKKEEDQGVRGALIAKLRKLNVSPNTAGFSEIKGAAEVLQRLGWFPDSLRKELWGLELDVANKDSDAKYAVEEEAAKRYRESLSAEIQRKVFDMKVKSIKSFKGQVGLVVGLALNGEKPYAGDFHEKEHFYDRLRSAKTTIEFLEKRYPSNEGVEMLGKEFDEEWDGTEKSHVLFGGGYEKGSHISEEDAFREFQEFVSKINKVVDELRSKYE